MTSFEPIDWWAEALTEARRLSGFTLEEAADHVGLEPGVLQKWETGGERPVCMRTIVQLTSLYQTDRPMRTGWVVRDYFRNNMHLPPNWQVVSNRQDLRLTCRFHEGKWLYEGPLSVFGSGATELEAQALAEQGLKEAASKILRTLSVGDEI